MQETARRWLNAFLWSLAGALAFWSRGYAIAGGNDLWWHLATGRLIVEGRAIPEVDPWSFAAAGSPWIVDSWLGDVILFLWSDWFGVESLVWWKWGVLIATFLLLMRLLWRITEMPALSWLLASAAAMTATILLDLRPQMHSLLCLVILLDVTVERGRPPWLLPLLFVFWANLHAGFALGLLLLPIVVWPSLVDRATRVRTLGLMLACTAACLINPNGHRALTQPLLYAFQTGSPFQAISEWDSPFGARAIDAPLYPYVLALVGLAVVYQLVRGVRGQPWRVVAIGLALLTAVMSLRSQKFISFFAIGSSVLLAQAGASLLRRPLSKVPSLPAAAGAIVLGAVLLFPYPQRSYAFHYLASEYSLPIETVHFIQKNELAGNVFSYYQWGGYLDYRTEGRFSVFIDGRASTVFAPEVFEAYTAVSTMRPGWLEVVNGSRASYVLWPLSEQSRIEELVRSGVWNVLHTDAVSALLVRSGHEPGSMLVSTDDSAHKDLAMGHMATRRGMHALAAEQYAKALAKIPHEWRACSRLAVAQARSGDVEEGWRTVERCERIFPGLGLEQSYRRVVRSLDGAN